MAQITSLLAGKNRNYDHQITALHKALINPWVISGLAVTAGQVAVGEAFIECTRSNGEKIMVHFQNTAPLNIDTSGNKKIFIEVKQEHIDNGIINAEDGSNIAEIKSGANYPTKNFIKLASIRNGEITDESTKITLKNIARKGLTENGFVVVEDGEEKVISTLPENITDSIKVDTKRLITEIYGGITYTGIVREAIPNVWTPVFFWGWWKSVLRVDTLHEQNERDFSIPWEEFLIKKIYVSGNKWDWGREIKLNITTKTGSVPMKMTVLRKWSYDNNTTIYSEEHDVNIRATDYRIEWTHPRSDTKSWVEVELDRERWFYVSRRLSLTDTWWVVWLAKNKTLWEEMSVEDLQYALKIPVDLADGTYAIKSILRYDDNNVWYGKCVITQDFSWKKIFLGKLKWWKLHLHTTTVEYKTQ